MILLIWLGCGLAAAAIASSKGRSAGGWLILGLLFGPLALLGAAIMSPDHTVRNSRRERALIQDGKMRRCPYCQEAIQSEARVCRFCQRGVMPEPRRGLFG